MDNSSSHWMQGMNLHKGAFTAKAQAHKMGVKMYAKEVMDGKAKASTKTKRQASLAETFEKLVGHGPKAKSSTHSAWSPMMSMSQDDTYDNSHGIKEDSTKDKKLDARLDVNKGMGMNMMSSKRVG